MSSAPPLDTTSPANVPRPHWPLPPKGVAMVGVIVVAACLACLAVLRAWSLPPFDAGEEVTDNAYVRGRTTLMAPQVSGYVVSVEVMDYATVNRGDVLVRIDDRLYRAAVDQAQAAFDVQTAALANLEQAHASKVAARGAQDAAVVNARAQRQRASADFARVDELVKDGSLSQREQDQARAALAQADAQVSQALATAEIARQDIRTVEVSREGAKAQIEAARAQLRAARINLDNTVVRAPEGGQLGEVGVRVGQYVTNGSQLLQLVPRERWLIANFKEAQTAGMHPGQSCYFTVDALGGRRFAGHVERVSPAAASEFSVLKPDNGTGNFVKIPQRIGVRIVVDGDDASSFELRPGMSVVVHVEAAASPAAGKS